MQSFPFCSFRVKLCFPFFIEIFAVLSFAVFACVGLDFELSVFPGFLRFWVFFFTVWTFGHGNHFLVLLVEFKSV